MKPLALHIDTIEKLYQCYMPFVEYGGLFIPTDENASIGEKLQLNLHMMTKDYSFECVVVWVTPESGIIGLSRPKGIGIQIPVGHQIIKNEIEKLLVGIKAGSIQRFTF